MYGIRLNELNLQEKKILLCQGTEAPFSGKFNEHKEKGIYSCKQCDQELFDSEDKFDSGTGWPSFDESIAGAVDEVFEGSYAEIVCSRCQGHLGHVFRGGEMTPKSTRHCVNSLALDFFEL